MLARRAVDDYARPWMLVGATPFLALAFIPASARAVVAVSACLATLAAAATVGHGEMLGQYSLILAPALALTTAIVLTQVPRRWRSVARMLGLAQLAASIVEWRRCSSLEDPGPDPMWVAMGSGKGGHCCWIGPHRAAKLGLGRQP